MESKIDNFLGYFLHGLKLKSYEFKKYKKKEQRNITINIFGNKNKPSNQTQLSFLKALNKALFYARDLVSEPEMFYTQTNMQKE